VTSNPRAGLLLLADSRLPAGGYAHSGGLEPAVHDHHVATLADVERFVVGRLHTAGRVSAAFAAAACQATRTGNSPRMVELDTGLDARMPSPAARATSRQLGRQLLRVAAQLVDDDRLGQLGRTPHHSIAFGTVCAAFDLTPYDAALAVLHETVAGVVAAAVRLLSVDPLTASGIIARCTGLVDDLATGAEAVCTAEMAALPADAAPLLDLMAQAHARRTGRLFAS
jgi:urease accessory protein